MTFPHKFIRDPLQKQHLSEIYPSPSRPTYDNLGLCIPLHGRGSPHDSNRRRNTMRSLIP